MARSFGAALPSAITFSQASARVLRSFCRSRQTGRSSLSWGLAVAGTAIDNSAAATTQRVRNIVENAPAQRRLVDRDVPRFIARDWSIAAGRSLHRALMP